MARTFLFVPCSSSWHIPLDVVTISRVQGIDSATGAILVAKPQKAGSKIKGLGSPIAHEYNISEAPDGADQWIMPLAPGINHGTATSVDGRSVVALQCDVSKNIVTFRFTDPNGPMNAEAFLVTPIPPTIDETQLKNLEPIPKVSKPQSRPSIKVACSYEWTLEVEPGIEVALANVDTVPKGPVLRVSRSDYAGKKPLTIALSPGAHVGVLKTVDKPTEDDQDELKPGTEKVQEWLLRLADGITWSPGPGTRQMTLTAPDKAHHIAAVKLNKPAEITFIVSPVPPQNTRTEVEGKSKTTIIHP